MVWARGLWWTRCSIVWLEPVFDGLCLVRELYIQGCGCAITQCVMGFRAFL